MKLPILIVGMGKSGQAALRLLILLGYPRDQIKTFDSKVGAGDFSKPEQSLAYNPQTLVVSPGVDLKTTWVQQLVTLGSDLTSEVDLAAQQLSNEHVIGITGSMGKSTTTSLLYEGAKAFSNKVFAGGNLGDPLANYVCDVLENKRSRAEWVILELSSYQLENCPHLRAGTSIITALSPNHLERYDSLEEYYAAKWALKQKTSGYLFLNFDNTELARWSSSKLDSQCILVRSENPGLTKFSLNDANLIGSHNKQNLALAIYVAHNLKWPSTSFQAIKNYRGLEHRLEFVATRHNITYINDSKATTIDSVLAAVEACLPLVIPKKARLHLLLGGRDKNLPWQDLNTLKSKELLSCYFFGEFGETAKLKSGLDGNYFLNLKTLLQELSRHLAPKDLVLLSPGGSSLDEFKGFEDRGNYFKDWVHHR